MQSSLEAAIPNYSIGTIAAGMTSRGHRRRRRACGASPDLTQPASGSFTMKILPSMTPRMRLRYVFKLARRHGATIGAVMIMLMASAGVAAAILSDQSAPVADMAPLQLSPRVGVLPSLGASSVQIAEAVRSRV